MMSQRSASWKSYFEGSETVYVLLFSLISFDLIYSFSIDKHLSADGAHYLAFILDRGDFICNTRSRQFGNYLTQWPLVFAIKLGLKNVQLLSYLYAFGLYFPYILSYAICLYAVRRENSFLLSYPLISMIGINLTTDYILIGEHHVMVLLAWPILSLLVRKEPLTWLDGGILWILFFLFSGTYETAIIPAIIFSAILLERLYRFRQSKKQLIIYSVSLYLCFIVFSIALHFILDPVIPSNRADFISGILIILRNKAAIITAIFTFFYIIGLVFNKKAVLLASLIPITYYAYIILFFSHGPTAYESFSSRTLSLSLLPFLIICSIISIYYHIKQNGISRSVLVLFVLVMVIGNLRFSSDWNNFRKQVIDLVSTKQGFIPIEETNINDSPYGWKWNNPELGIILSYPCVKAILLNTPDIQWPFNPREKLILKSYVSYDVFFRHIDENIMLCK